jgi:hypothetical protein
MCSIIIAVLFVTYDSMCHSHTPSRKHQIMVKFTELWILSIEPALCHPSSIRNLEVASRFVENCGRYTKVYTHLISFS